ncbi:MAG: 3-hydroxyacyl-ACP dehydratase FabZ [Legionellales bacterium]|nr:3-hydroxyacyl-ACP dehydratase FabZ [Legionellales bacterium]
MTEVEDILQIFAQLPHRYPFLLVDRIVESDDSHLIAIKNVTINEPFFSGHFPNNPVMPGVLMIEALAQAGGILAHKISQREQTEKRLLHYLAGVNNTRFRHVVTPGDQLRLEVQMVTRKRSIWSMKGEATVNGHVACSTELMSAAKEVTS